MCVCAVWLEAEAEVEAQSFSIIGRQTPARTMFNRRTGKQMWDARPYARLQLSGKDERRTSYGDRTELGWAYLYCFRVILSLSSVPIYGPAHRALSCFNTNEAEARMLACTGGKYYRNRRRIAAVCKESMGAHGAMVVPGNLVSTR